VKITDIELYGLELPLNEPYHLSRGRAFEGFESTFIRIGTDEGIVGWGEVCPWGSSYLPAFVGGLRTGVAELAQHLIGQDPRRIELVNRQMDAELPGHLYVKALIDYGLWDILGKAAGLPVCELLGGREDHRAPIVSSLQNDTPDRMVERLGYWRGRGYRAHSLKLGNGGVDADIARVKALAEQRREDELFLFDANGGWTPWEAIRVMNAAKGLDAWFEQPCITYEQCLTVRRKTEQSMSLDEVIVDVPSLSRAIADQACDVVNIKLARVGGLTRARQIRDLCLSAGIPMLIMCMAGTVVNDTAVAHFAQAIPGTYCLGTWSCQDMVTVDPAPERGARNIDGYMAPPDLPGLGVEPDVAVLGEPIARFTP
jgi:L-alanine-DL-glutamate epimerase-like enolase superfamily enzyme